MTSSLCPGPILFEPVFAGLNPEQQKNVIGLGCQVWTEWIADVEKLHRHVFPRIAAYAETGWTRKEDKNFQDFQRRLTGYEKFWMPRASGTVKRSS